MKTWIYFIGMGIFLLACQPKENNSLSSSFEQEYTKKFNQELKKVKQNPQNKILLGFELGMSEEMYQKHFETLVTSQKLKPLVEFNKNHKFASTSSDTTDYFYPLEIETESYPLHFVPTFEESKLTLLSAKLTPHLGEKKTETLYENLVKLYTEKYGKDFLERVNMYKPNDFLWLEANRQISLSLSFSSIQINYQDSRFMNVNLMKGEKHQEQKTSTSLEDI